MKSLNEFKQNPVLEEEKVDYSKFDLLVRAGLANKAQLQRIHRILDKMQEERPQFNNADKMILQNLFNRMVDLISNNKQIFQKARTVVREETDLEEGVLDSSDYKLSPSGRKVRAHRIVLSKSVTDDENNNQEVKEEIEIVEDRSAFDPPFVLLLKRKAIRYYPDGTRVALYYNDKLGKYFSVPYSTTDNISSVIQSEETHLEEAVMDTLHKIVKNKQAATVKFANGQTRKVDGYTASAITQVHNALNDENKKKFADMVHKSPEHFTRASTFAFSKVK